MHRKISKYEKSGEAPETANNDLKKRRQEATLEVYYAASLLPRKQQTKLNTIKLNSKKKKQNKTKKNEKKKQKKTKKTKENEKTNKNKKTKTNKKKQKTMATIHKLQK